MDRGAQGAADLDFAKEVHARVAEATKMCSVACVHVVVGAAMINLFPKTERKEKTHLHRQATTERTRAMHLGSMHDAKSGVRNVACPLSVGNSAQVVREAAVAGRL